MTPLQFLEKEVEAQKNIIIYCQKDLDDRKRKLFMFEQMLESEREKTNAGN